ncbi:MAG: hypothetical protein L0Z49_12350, partial [Actinobacteria bacterium]|nr:hypothetical protein [Actinomycetota bacterium]
DTLFAERLFGRGYTPVLAADAVVEWEPPRDLAAQARTMFNWGYGDGLQGLRSRHYLEVLVATGGLLGLIVVLALIEPWLLLLAPLALLPYLRRSTAYKYRHMEGWSRWLLIPLATINGVLSSLVGYLLGRARRVRS